tara:strand:- start:347 stop:559 length:213 start_codon:yes stop_codon:yes gene_type:complete
LAGGFTSLNYRSWPLPADEVKRKEVKGEAFWVDCEAVDPKTTHKPKRHQLALSSKCSIIPPKMFSITIKE